MINLILLLLLTIYYLHTQLPQPLPTYKTIISYGDTIVKHEFIKTVEWNGETLRLNGKKIKSKINYIEGV